MPGNLDDLAASFQKDLKREKRERTTQRDEAFSRKVFRSLSGPLECTGAELGRLWSDEYDDPGYDIKYKYPGVAHIHTTGILIAGYKDLLRPATEIPHKLWERFMGALRLAAEYGREEGALVFRLKGNSQLVITNETLSIPALQPAILITAPAGAGEVRIIPWELYCKLLEEKL
jgi:hypothetical protein